MTSWVGATLALATLIACSAAPERRPGPPALSTRAPATPPPAEEEEETDDETSTMAADASSLVDEDAGGASATTFIGRLEQSKTTPFGGDPFCEYTMTLKDVVIEVAAFENGNVLSAVVRDVAVESSVPPCPHAPMSPAEQSFSLTTATATAAGATLAFEGGKGNRPKTSLVIDLTKVAGGYEAKASWHRTDQDAPLDWTVTETVRLSQR